MPIYDYVCSTCRHRVEVIHGINEPGPRFCPNCGTEGTMRKAPVSPAIHFKGSGWAKKDRSSTSSAGRKASTSSGDGASGDTGKSDATSPASDAGPGSSTSAATSSED